MLDVELEGDVDTERLLDRAAVTMRPAQLKLSGLLLASSGEAFLSERQELVSYHNISDLTV